MLKKILLINLFIFIFSFNTLAFLPFMPNPTFKIADLDKPLEEATKELLEDFDIKEILEKKIRIEEQRQADLESIMEYGTIVKNRNVDKISSLLSDKDSELSLKIVYVKFKKEVNIAQVENYINKNSNKNFRVKEMLKDNKLFKIKANEIDISEERKNLEEESDISLTTLKLDKIQTAIQKIEDLDNILYAHGNYYIDSYNDIVNNSDLEDLFNNYKFKNITFIKDENKDLEKNRKFTFDNKTNYKSKDQKYKFETSSENKIELSDERKEEILKTKSENRLNLEEKLLEKRRILNQELLLAIMMDNFSLNYNYFLFNENEFEGRNTLLNSENNSLYDLIVQSEKIINKALYRSKDKSITPKAFEQNQILLKNIQNKLLNTKNNLKVDRNILIYEYFLNNL